MCRTDSSSIPARFRWVSRREKSPGHIQGSGTETGIHTPTRIAYHDVPVPLVTDTVPCGFPAVTTRAVRVGFVGAGFARRVQLPALALVPGTTPTAIASGNRANAEAVAREFGLPHVFSDGVELARSPDVDLVIVSSTPDTHARFAIAALEAGNTSCAEKTDGHRCV